MITIEYHRFVLDTKEVVHVCPKLDKVLYNEVLDHTETMPDSECPVTRARQVASNWLKDHYGYVRIIADSEDGTIRHRLCNHVNMWKTYIKNGVLVQHKRG